MERSHLVRSYLVGLGAYVRGSPPSPETASSFRPGFTSAAAYLAGWISVCREFVRLAWNEDIFISMAEATLQADAMASAVFASVGGGSYSPSNKKM